VLVGVDYAPVNPADINVLEGKYGALPALPAVPGVEGVGTVLESRAAGLEPGQRVLLPGGFGTWRERGVVDGRLVVPVPANIPLQQAAMLRINPATAYCLLREFETLQPGDWVVQNASNSGVGRAVIQIAKLRGLRTLNVVRRGGLESELAGEGGDVVLVEGTHLARRIREAAGGADLRLGLNAVGGESALEMARALSDSGTLVTYGAMARQPLGIPNGLLIFKNLRFCGFWVSRWYREAPRKAVSALFSELVVWVGEGKVRTPVEAVYPLERIREALAHACREFRGGKVLLAPQAGRGAEETARG
jgi:NADPH:quinone reductase-like Zn-dependent oxidoreductase